MQRLPSGSRGPRPEAVPIRRPTEGSTRVDDDQFSMYASPSRDSWAPRRSSGVTKSPYDVARDNLSGSRGSTSLAAGKGKGKAGFSTSDFYGTSKDSKPSMGSLSNGAPYRPALTPQRQERRLALDFDGDISQHRNASNSHGKKQSHSNSRDHQLHNTRSAARHKQATITIDDSDEEQEIGGDSAVNTIPDGNLSPQHSAQYGWKAAEVSMSSGEDGSGDRSVRRDGPAMRQSGLSPSASVTERQRQQSAEDPVRRSYGGSQRSHTDLRSPSPAQPPSHSPQQDYLARKNKEMSQTIPLVEGRSFCIASVSDAAHVGQHQSAQSKMRDKEGKFATVGTTSRPKKSRLPSAESFRSTMLNQKGKQNPVPNDSSETIFINLNDLGVLDVGVFYANENQPCVSWSPTSKTITLLWQWTEKEKLHDGQVKLSLRDLQIVRIGPSQAGSDKASTIAISLEKGDDALQAVAEHLPLVPPLQLQHLKHWIPGVILVLQRYDTVDKEYEEKWSHFVRHVRTGARDPQPMSDDEISTLRRRMSGLENFPDAMHHLKAEILAVEDEQKRGPPRSAAKRAVQDEEDGPPLTRRKPKPSVRHEGDERVKQVRSSSNSARLSAGPQPSNKQRMCYPFEGKQAVTVFQSDMDKLSDGEFLNDTIIELGLKYHLEEIRKDNFELYSQIYVFSSFFYKRYTEKGRHNYKEGFSLVSKWTSKVDIFSKKYLVVPINENLHWYLAIILNPLYAFSLETRAHLLPQTAAERANADEETKTEIGSDGEVSFGRLKKGLSQSKMQDSIGNLPAGVSVEADIDPPLFACSDEYPQSLDQDGDQPMHDAIGSHTDFGVPFPVLDMRTDPQREWRRGSESSDMFGNPGSGALLGGGGGEGSQKGVSGDRGGPRKSTRSSTRTSLGAIDVDAPTQSKLTQFPSSRSLSDKGLRSQHLPPSEHRSIDALGKQIKSGDEQWRDWIQGGAVVLLFDSMNGKHKAVQRALREYLCYELADKRGVEVDGHDATLHMIDVPMLKQPNHADCGLYLLHAFERFFSDSQRFLDKVLVPPRDEAEYSDFWREAKVLDAREWWRTKLKNLADQWIALRTKLTNEKKALLSKNASENRQDESEAHEDEAEDDGNLFEGAGSSSSSSSLSEALARDD